eukprot:gene44512-2076_t
MPPPPTPPGRVPPLRVTWAVQTDEEKPPAPQFNAATQTDPPP